MTGAKSLPMESIRGAREIFKAAVEAEERKKLVESLLDKGLGVPSVEHYHKKQGSARRVLNVNNIKRNKSFISRDMNLKLSDAVMDLKKKIRSKVKVKKRIYSELGDEQGDLLIEELQEEAEKLRIEIQEKNLKKTDHLSRKFLPDQKKLPASLVRYERCSVFTGEESGESLSSPDLPLVYGELNLDEDERAALILDPKFALFDKLYEENFETEMEMCFAKMRWNQFDKCDDDDDEKEEDISEAEQEKNDLMEAQSRQAFDSESKCFDMRNLRATDVKLNTFVVLPEPQSVKYEAGLELRRDKYLSEFRNYVKQNCDKGFQQKPNLTSQQRKGIKKLSKRVADGEIIICLTDKSGRLAVLPMEMYHEAAKVHIGKDVEVDFHEAERTQKLLNGHVSSWLKMTRMGEKWQHQDRQRATHMENSVSIAPLYLLIKDHKKYSGSGPPPTRPVCGAISGMNVHLSNILSPYLDALASEMPNSMEVISTEDALSRIDEFNSEEEIGDALPAEEECDTDEEEFLSQQEIKESQKSENKQYNDIVICGADVTSMFPSLKSKSTSKIVFDTAAETEISFEGIDFKEVVTYLAINMSDHEIKKNKFCHLLPSRKTKRGQKPTITGYSAMSAESCHDRHWRYPRLVFTDQEQKLLFAKALEIGTYTLFQNHLYQFGGKIYKQTDGAPIGVRASMSASRVVMGRWDRELHNILVENKLVIRFSFRYCDDLRLVMGSIREGWRWVDGRLMFRKCWEKEEREMSVSGEERTACEMKKLMDSIFSNLKFEMETPIMFENKRLPTLDFECWVSDNKVLYSFYEKPMARKTQIQRKSALGENVKIASLTQNLMRRMKNTSELIPNEERVQIVEEYTTQLRRSGYSVEQTKSIIIAGLKGYETLVNKCLNGKSKMHRSAAEGPKSRKVKKLLGKARWFKKRKKIEKEKRRKKNQRQSEDKKPPEIVTVMFVPQTPGGALVKRLKIVENEISKLTGERVKIVERGGTQVKQILHKSNPWSQGFCDRENCLPCLHGDGKQNCFEKNVVYKISCLECADEKNGDKIKAAVYVGQTSRSLYERGQEHLLGLRKMHDNSPLFKHVSEDHNGNNNINFEMKTVKKHFSAFSRLVNEAVMIDRISKSNSCSTLNSRGEWGRSHLPRLKIDEVLSESRENLVKKNNFSKSLEEWNVSETRNLKEKVKRKASPETKTDDDDTHDSNPSETFNFSKSDIETSSKAAKFNSNTGGPKVSKQTKIFRFLAADHNFKTKKLKLSK